MAYTALKPLIKGDRPTALDNTNHQKTEPLLYTNVNLWFSFFPQRLKFVDIASVIQKLQDQF